MLGLLFRRWGHRLSYSLTEGRLKTCRQCGQIQPFSKFYKKTNGLKTKGGYASECKPCTRARRSKYVEENPEKIKHQDLMQNFGISIEQYNDMFAGQKGCCAICSVHSSELSKNFAVDHCHSTGLVRGLLCDKCNRGIGLLGDNADILRLASEYVLKTGLAETTNIVVMPRRRKEG